jgi:hypothetical protein
MHDPDRLAVVVLLVAFAALLTMHVAIAIGLARHPHPWRAVVAFFVAPLAPWWGWRLGMRARAGIWVLAATGYAWVLARS